MRGFNTYRRAVGPWTLDDAGQLRPFVDRVLGRASMLHGVLAHVTDTDLAGRLQATGLPVVDLAGFVPDTGFARVLADNQAVGRLAAAYFLERRFSRLLFVSSARYRFERDRWAGFRAAAEAHKPGPRIGWYTLEGGRWLDDAGERTMSHDAFNQMLRDADEPIGVFAASDRPGMEMADRCRTIGLGVPERVAILGCDNNTYLCESCEPPLSSVMLPGEKLGHEAAKLLHAMMDGTPTPRELIVLPPVGIQTRHSTDITAIADRPIADALSLMRQRATEHLNVVDLADAVHMDRRTFYRHFRKAIGRTPLAELYRLRVEHARQRLIATNADIYTIAIESGFPDADTFTRRFREHTGMTPSAYRRKMAV